jgi:hypothetical protein
MKWLNLLVVLTLAACTGDRMPHIPPFARLPYEAFSREAVVAIALREWRLFGTPVNEGPMNEGPADTLVKPERQQGLWQRVGEYWWLGLDSEAPERGWTGRHDGLGKEFPAEQDGDFAWSAAFVSYVMRIAGAGTRFPYAADHAEYINAAKRMKLGAAEGWLFMAERVEAYAPRPGDLICFGRNASSGLRYDDLPTARLFPAHCDIVVDTARPNLISVIGGNIRDAVSMTHVPVAADGKLVGADKVVLDPRSPWMAVLRLLDES